MEDTDGNGYGDNSDDCVYTAGNSTNYAIEHLMEMKGMQIQMMISLMIQLKISIWTVMIWKNMSGRPFCPKHYGTSTLKVVDILQDL